MLNSLFIGESPKKVFTSEKRSCAITLKGAIEMQKQKSNFKGWTNNDSTKYFDGRDEITVNDDISFRTICEAVNTVFGTDYKGIQRAGFVPKTIRGSNIKFWTPILAVSGKAVSDGWNNQLSNDGLRIYEFNEDPVVESKKEKVRKLDECLRVTFIKVKDAVTNRWEYRFVGVFKPCGWEGRQRVYERIADNFKIIRNVQR